MARYAAIPIFCRQPPTSHQVARRFGLEGTELSNDDQSTPLRFRLTDSDFVRK